MKRILISIIAGAAFGFALISPIGDALGQVPGARFIFLPAEWIFALSRDLDIAPHGDAGFVMIPVSLILEGACIGALVGCVLQWRYHRKASNQSLHSTLEDQRE